MKSVFTFSRRLPRPTLTTPERKLKKHWIDYWTFGLLCVSVIGIGVGATCFDISVKRSMKENADIQATNMRLLWWQRIIERRDSSFTGFSEIVGDLASIQKNIVQISDLHDQTGSAQKAIESQLLAMAIMDKCNKLLFVNRKIRMDYYATIAELHQMGGDKYFTGVAEYIAAQDQVNQCAISVESTIKQMVGKVVDYAEGKSSAALRKAITDGDSTTTRKIVLQELQTSYASAQVFMYASNHPGLIAMEQFILRNARASGNIQ